MERKEIFRNRLKCLRTGRKLSQQKIADAIGISKVGYQYYEYGQKMPSFETLPRLAVLFNVSADYLLGLSDEPRLPDKETLRIAREIQAMQARKSEDKNE